MSQHLILALYFVAVLFAVNLPWISDRVLFVIRPKSGNKAAWVRIFEWTVMYGVVIGIGFGFEKKITGTTHAQDWEFYAVTVCILMVVAVPGFLYRYQVKPLLGRGR